MSDQIKQWPSARIKSHLLGGQPPGLEPYVVALRLSYAEYQTWKRQAWQTQSSHKQIFLARLTKLPELTLPTLPKTRPRGPCYVWRYGLPPRPYTVQFRLPPIMRLILDEIQSQTNQPPGDILIAMARLRAPRIERARSTLHLDDKEQARRVRYVTRTGLPEQWFL